MAGSIDLTPRSGVSAKAPGIGGIGALMNLMTLFVTVFV